MLYENKILLKEFSPTTVNTLIKDGNHNNLYLMKSYKKNEDGTYNGEIDTIDERLKRAEELKKLQ